MRVSFRIKLMASHAAVALAVGAVALLVVERAVSSRLEALVDSRLEAQAGAVGRWLEQARHPDRLAGRLAGVVGARVTIVDEAGVAVGESSETVDTAVDLSQLEEVAAARAGRIGHATRYSTSVGEHVRFIAVPAPDGGVVRLGLPIGELEDTQADIRRQLGLGALASLFVALALAAFVAAALTRRLRATRELAQRIGAGDYDVSTASSSPGSGDEVGVLADTLIAAARELEETEARRREFLANVAHEIRTPVTSIRGYAETLAGAAVDADTQREFLQTIHRNAVRIGQLVEDLLELEALQAGKNRALALEPVEVAQVMRHVSGTLAARIRELGAEVRVAIDDGVSVQGDTDAIERILLNLVDNALRHVGPGVEVEVEAAVRADRVTIVVRDNGPGIPAEQRSRIFERFHRGAGAGDRDGGGSGLGLAIARELAQAMGGTLVLGAPVTGTEFRLELAGC